MPVVLPPHLRQKIGTENLVKATLAAIDKAGAEGYPVAQLRDRFRVLGVSPALAQFVENRLVRERIVVLKAERLHLGTLEDIKAFLARSKWDDSKVIAIAPAAPRGVA